jgi:uncharacterized protein (DUF169 family)
MPDRDSFADLAARLTRALDLRAAPIGIAFLAPGETSAVPAFAGSAPPPNRAGRTGSVPAGCAFWMKAQDAAFSTGAADHANCSVGSYTHGFLTLAEAARTDDVAAVLEAGWVEPSAVESLPHVRTRPDRIAYGPLATLPVAPDVVLIRVIGSALMTLRNGLGELRIEGKPQCHIVALALEHGEPAASLGCALSRARTGMPPEEMTCALPAAALPDLVARIEAAAELDRAMARYATADARRFA